MFGVSFMDHFFPYSFFTVKNLLLHNHSACNFPLQWIDHCSVVCWWHRSTRPVFTGNGYPQFILYAILHTCGTRVSDTFHILLIVLLHFIIKYSFYL
jgi:hypothetical protein